MYQVRQAPRREQVAPVEDDALENVVDVPEAVEQEMELEERNKVETCVLG